MRIKSKDNAFPGSVVRRLDEFVNDLLVSTMDAIEGSCGNSRVPELGQIMDISENFQLSASLIRAAKNKKIK
jgi:hypothetical protein